MAYPPVAYWWDGHCWGGGYVVRGVDPEECWRVAACFFLTPILTASITSRYNEGLAEDDRRGTTYNSVYIYTTRYFERR